MGLASTRLGAYPRVQQNLFFFLHCLGNEGDTWAVLLLQIRTALQDRGQYRAFPCVSLSHEAEPTPHLRFYLRVCLNSP
jgi:hypothetical protein